MGQKSGLQTRVFNQLYALISNDDFKDGDYIPTASRLAEMYGVSRPTIHKALKRLREDGYLETKTGTGTRIIQKPRNDESSLIFGLIFPLLNMEGFFSPLAQAIASLSKRHQFQIVWGGQFSHPAFTPSDLDHMSDFYIQQKISGVFLSPVELDPEGVERTTRLVQKLSDARIPIVLIDADFLPFPLCSDMDFVSIDNYRAGYLLTEHLLSKGDNRVDFCSLPYVGQTVHLRLRGVRGALLDHGITPSSEWFHLFQEEDSNFGKKLKDNGVRNIICSNDWLAIRLMRKLQEESFRIPEDFRVAAFDNSMFGQNTVPKLTSIDQRCDDLAVLAIKAMLNRINDPLSPSLRLFSKFSLEERASTQ